MTPAGAVATAVATRSYFDDASKPAGLRQRETLAEVGHGAGTALRTAHYENGRGVCGATARA